MSSLRSFGYASALGLAVLLACLISAGRSTTAGAVSSLTTATTAAEQYPFYNSTEITKALEFIKTKQQPNGGIDAFGLGSANDGGTARTVLALVAAGRPIAWMTSSEGKTMLDYLRTRATSYPYDLSGTSIDDLVPQEAGLLLAATAAANADGRSFGGVNLVGQLEATLRPTGAYSTTAVDSFITGEAGALNQAWAIIGLSAAGRSVPISATSFLIGLQAPNGSWEGIDTTGIAVTALIGSGNVAPTDAAIRKAMGYLEAQQDRNGGWRTPSNQQTNANSTGWAMQAAVMAGYTPVTESWGAERNPRRALLALQKADGSIGGDFVNAYGTAEAIYGLSERPLLPLGGRARALRALSWLNEIQGDNGAWPVAFPPAAGPAIDGALAFAAAGFDPKTVRRTPGNPSVVDYLASQAIAYTRNQSGTLPAQAGKLLVGVVASGANPRSFGTPTTIDLVADLKAILRPTGAYSSSATGAGAASASGQAWAMIGLRAAGETVPVSATNYLKSLQENDGGWGFGFGGDAYATGLVLQALAAAQLPPTDPAVVKALAFLRTQQDAQGGWNDPGTTAFVMQGLLAMGEDSGRNWQKNGRSPFEALAIYQKSDGPFVATWRTGGFFSPGVDDDFYTRQAVPALLGAFFPLTNTAGLQPFTPLRRGPDPDRLVVIPGEGRLIEMTGSGTAVAATRQVEVRIPFGSDLDRDGNAAFAWRLLGATTWTSATLTREDGFFKTTIQPGEAPKAIEFRTIFSDSDQVQTPDNLAATREVTGTLEPKRIWLPLVRN